MIRRYARVGWAIADQILVSGTSFATTFLVARFLGKEEFGRFVLAWLAVWIVQNIQIALITTPITTFASREPPEHRAAYFGAVTVQQLVFAAITTSLALLATLLSGKIVPEWRLDTVAFPLALVILFGQIADIQRRYFYINERTAMTFALDASRCGSQLAGLVALFFLYAANATLYGAIAVIALSALIGCIVGLVFMGPLALDWRIVKDVHKRHWAFSRWLLGGTLVNCARETFVNVSVGSLLGLSEVGLLRAVQQLVLIINIPLFVMHNIVPAPASRAFGERGFTGLMAYMRGFALRYFCFLCALLLAIGASGEWLLTTVYGRSYGGHGWLVTTYALIMIVFLVRDFMALIVKTTESTDFDFYASVLGSIVSVLLLFPLVRHLGLAGAFLNEALMHFTMLAVIGRGLHRQWRRQPTT